MIKVLKKKFKPRIKARIRKNKQLLNKNIDNFFDWIKGAELVELKKCNTDEFIKKSRLKYGNNTFDYTKCIYTTVTNPVILICNNCY